jgi:hypothetical protein
VAALHPLQRPPAAQRREDVKVDGELQDAARRDRRVRQRRDALGAGRRGWVGVPAGSDWAGPAAFRAGRGGRG